MVAKGILAVLRLARAFTRAALRMTSLKFIVEREIIEAATQTSLRPDCAEWLEVHWVLRSER